MKLGRAISLINLFINFVKSIGVFPDLKNLIAQGPIARLYISLDKNYNQFF